MSHRHASAAPRPLEDAAAAPHPADFVGNRRHFLEAMAASLALAAGGCMSQPAEEIVPYVKAPPGEAAGRTRQYATALTLAGYATGVLAACREGRPIRIDGNPDHPASLGAVDSMSQAALLDLYDPDRAQAITSGGVIRTWDLLAAAIHKALEVESASRGRGLFILTPAISSPTLAAQLARVREVFPEAKWRQHEPIHADRTRAAMRQALGRPLEIRGRFDRAEAVVAFDRDFLASGPGSLRYARDFMAARQPGGVSERPLNRLYVAEPSPTPTGASADHRVALSPRRLAAAVRSLARRAGIEVETVGDDAWNESERKWLDAAARDLTQHRGAALVLGGSHLPVAEQMLIAALNDHLGAAGRTVEYTEPITPDTGPHAAALGELADDIAADRVRVLLVLEGNPVFTAPPELRLGDLLRRVPLSAHLSLWADETSECCTWHVPAAHPLESWSDARAYSGETSIVQPVIAPLYGGKSGHDVLELLLEREPARRQASYELVRAHWRRELGAAGFDAAWHDALYAGVIAGTRFAPLEVALRPDALSELSCTEPDESPLEVNLRPDPTIYDGRFANNGWLRELPQPITRLSWQAAALLSPATAGKLGIARGDELEVSAGGKSILLPALVLPGHADGCVTLPLGHGRRRGGRFCDGSGPDAYQLLARGTDQPAAIQLRRTGRQVRLIETQGHHRMEGRDLVRQSTFAEQSRSRQDEKPSDPALVELPTLLQRPFPPAVEEGIAWGMSINLGTCTGCSACVIACQMENNIPVVGAEQVALGRDMHWLRIDAYFDGEGSEARVLQQPVPCMHCENAPCELVCPVGATVHSAEGLNEMVYNRCVGTRYCSNNCPYKVRRFNFLDYRGEQPPVLELLPNPEVTVRSRGVMEKCTYCVQRIVRGRIDAEVAGRPLVDGDVITACQAACPTQAIVFGNIRDAGSEVSRRKSLPADYGLLTELNTKPRTTYLPQTKNPHPDLT